MSELRAVIFDMDGVLVDSYDAHLQSWQRIAAPHGYEMTPARFAATFGRTSREIIAELWGDGRLTDEQIARLDDQKEALYREILQADFPVMDGAEELIDALHADGFVLAIGSSGPPQNVHLVIERLGWGKLLGAAVTGEDVTRGKPDPQVFLVASERLGVPPARCAVVEDAPLGVAAARAARMTSIALASTGRTREQLADANLVVDSLRELSPQLIRRLIDSPG